MVSCSESLLLDNLAGITSKKGDYAFCKESIQSTGAGESHSC